MIDPKRLEMVRREIGDGSAPYTYSNDTIEDVYEQLNKNLGMTIAHFLFARAAALTFPSAPSAPSLDASPTGMPSAPAAPTLSSSPTTSMGVWTRDTQNDLSLFTQQSALYRAQADVQMGVWERQSRNKLDLYAQQVTGYRTQADVVRVQVESYRDRARQWMELAAKGMVL